MPNVSKSEQEFLRVRAIARQREIASLMLGQRLADPARADKGGVR